VADGSTAGAVARAGVVDAAGADRDSDGRAAPLAGSGLDARGLTGTAAVAGATDGAGGAEGTGLAGVVATGGAGAAAVPVDGVSGRDAAVAGVVAARDGGLVRVAATVGRVLLRSQPSTVGPTSSPRIIRVPTPRITRNHIAVKMLGRRLIRCDTSVLKCLIQEFPKYDPLLARQC
jgi:hypothetical protein